MNFLCHDCGRKLASKTLDNKHTRVVPCPWCIEFAVKKRKDYCKTLFELYLAFQGGYDKKEIYESIAEYIDEKLRGKK